MLDYLVDRKTPGMRQSNEMIGQLMQVPIAIAPVGGLSGAGADESPDASAGFDHPGAFQLGINPGHRVRVNAQFDRQLPHCRQLIADLQPRGRDREANRPFQLSVKRRWMVGIYLKHCCPIVLRQWYNGATMFRSEEHTSELQSLTNLVCRLLLENINSLLGPASIV